MAEKRTKSPPASGEKATAKLDALGIDWYCEQIVSGKTMGAVAALAGVSRRSVVRWLMADEDRFKQGNAARVLSAEAFDEQAEEAIKKAKNPFELAKAREEAFHKRWRSSKIAPKVYGDRQELVGAGGEPLIPKVDPMEGARRICFALAMADRELNKQHSQVVTTPSS